MTTPTGWRKGWLGEECSIEIGGTPSRNVAAYWDDSRETDNLWVSIRDLRDHVITHTAEHITALGVRHSNVKLQPPGTVLLSFKLTIGRVAVTGLPLYTNEAIAALRSQSILHDYLYHGLQQWDLLQGIDQAIKGVTLNKQKLKIIEFDFPESKSEQAQIAEVLSTLDRAVEQTEAMIAKQERIKAGLMQDLLTLGVDEHGNVRSEQTHVFKDSPLGRVPVEWDVKPCLALCRAIVVGIVIRPVQYYKPDGVPVLRSANVREDGVDFSNLVFMSEKDNEMLSKSQLCAGDLVTVRTGYPGTTAVVPKELHGSNCVDIVISRPDHEKVQSDFLSIWINSHHGKRQVLEGQGGLAQQHFNVGAMKCLLVKVPSLAEQQRIAELLAQQGATARATANSLAKLRSLKAGLMRDLLSGRKRVAPLVEAATQLAERVS